MAAFDLTEIQANAILDTRLRQLAKLEEMELRREHDALSAEKAGLEALLGSDKLQWKKVGEDLRKARDALAKTPAIARRRLHVRRCARDRHRGGVGGRPSRASQSP